MAFADADLVIVLGVDWDFRTGFGQKPGTGVPVVHVDAEAGRVGWNRVADVGVVEQIPERSSPQLLTPSKAASGRASDPALGR